MRCHPIIAVLIAATALAGCDMAPKYVRPTLPVPQALPPAGGEGGQDGAAVVADVAWRDFFTDEKLRRLIALALENNRDLRVAAANVEQARAQFHVQRADLGPTIGVNGGATYQKTPPGLASVGQSTGGAGVAGTNGRADIYSVDAGVSAWEIDLFGRLRNLTKAAQEQYFASREARNAAQTSLIAEVASAYLAMAADSERLRITRDTLGAFSQTLDLTRQRFDKGVSSEIDVRQAQGSYDQARADLANLTTLVAQDLNRLQLLLGTTVPDDLRPAGLAPSGSTIAALPADLSSTVLLRRPDIAEAEAKLRAANADIGAARAAFFPKISLTAVAGTLSLGLSNLFKDGSGSWSVAPSGTMPIFDFGRNAGNLRYAKATRAAALASYEKAVQSGFREVADALARRATIDAQLEAQISQREAAAGAYRLSEMRYRVGIEPFLNTLDSQRTLYSAELGLVATRLTAETNTVELYRSLGGGLR